MWIYRLKIDFVFMRVCIVVHMFPPYFYLLLITPWQCREIFINAWRIFVYTRIIVSRPWALCTCLYICDLCLVGISTSTLEKPIFSKNVLYTCTGYYIHTQKSHTLSTRCVRNRPVASLLFYQVARRSSLTTCWQIVESCKTITSWWNNL
jgi:hypothetical protein